MVEIKEFLESLGETIQNLGAFSIIAIITIIILLIILMMIERNLKKKVVVKETTVDPYLQKIMEIKGKNPEEILKKIDQVIRNLFKERFKIKKSLTYSEVAEIFKNRKNKSAEELSRKMDDLIYSGRGTDEDTNQKLIATLKEIINGDQNLREIKSKKELVSKTEKF